MSVSNIPYNKRGLIRKDPSFKHGTIIVFDSKEDARMALDLALSIVKREGYVTVFDIYSYLNIGATTEDDLIGWNNINGAYIKDSKKWNRKQFYLILPRLNMSR